MVHRFQGSARGRGRRGHPGPGVPMCEVERPGAVAECSLAPRPRAVAPRPRVSARWSGGLASPRPSVTVDPSSRPVTMMRCGWDVLDRFGRPARRVERDHEHVVLVVVGDAGQQHALPDELPTGSVPCAAGPAGLNLDNGAWPMGQCGSAFTYRSGYADARRGRTPLRRRDGSVTAFRHLRVETPAQSPPGRGPPCLALASSTISATVRGSEARPRGLPPSIDADPPHSLTPRAAMRPAGRGHTTTMAATITGGTGRFADTKGTFTIVNHVTPVSFHGGRWSTKWRARSPAASATELEARSATPEGSPIGEPSGRVTCHAPARHDRHMTAKRLIPAEPRVPSFDETAERSEA